jgi:choice-of-anchor B domain-containing protein
VVHRDYHDYNGYLYVVCDEGNSQSKLEILDLSDLPNSVTTVYAEDSLFVRSHNIFIDTATAKLYTCGGDQNPGVRVFSLANPAAPAEISSVTLPSTSHDIYVRNDTAYINDGTDGLLIYDFSDNANPTLIGSLTSYPQQGYNHSGWLNDAGSIYVLADETHGKDLKILDVSDLGNIQLLDTVTSQIDNPNTIPHNVMINGDFAYVSYYFDGLVIYNITDPSNPYISGYYDTSTETHANWVYRGCWGTYSLFPSGIVLASDMQNGLYVLDVGSAISSIATETEATSVVVFPNPFTESIVISTPKFDGATYTVSNLNGQMVEKGNLESAIAQVSLSQLPNGTYIVEVTAKSNSVFTKKLVKSN